jgi:hypothetical protein
MPFLAVARPAEAAGPAFDVCLKVNAVGDASVQQICKHVRYLGFGTFTELRLLPQNWNVLLAIDPTANGRQELAAKRHFFGHGPFVFTVLSDARHHVDMVVRTAAALDSLRRVRPAAYEFITSTMRFPTAPPLPGARRFDRAAAIFVSFDKTPKFIAAGATVDGLSAREDSMTLSSNYSLISIDEETIRGNDPNVGSRRIYKLPTPDANYRRYMTDGVMFTLVHEMAHRHIDHVRSTSQLARTMYEARDDTTASDERLEDAEEVVANETALALLGTLVSEEQATEVRRENLLLVRKPGVRRQLAKYAAVTVDARNLLVVPR